MATINDDPNFRRRGLIGSILLLPVGIALAFSKPVLPEESILDLLADLFGWFFFFLYLTFRLWATLYVGGRKDRELQTLGPYSITRNPLYFGSLCFALSAVFFFKSALLLFALCVVCGFYIEKVIKSEERHLESRFGEAFRAYCRRTPRLLPSPALYRSDDSVTIKMKAIGLEAKRLWLAALFPIAAEIIMRLRIAPWWPRWFHLP